MHGLQLASLRRLIFKIKFCEYIIVFHPFCPFSYLKTIIFHFDHCV